MQLELCDDDVQDQVGGAPRTERLMMLMKTSRVAV